MPSLAESMDQRIQIGIHNIGISIVNDDTSVEILFISLSKSKVVWTDTKKSRVKPLPKEVNVRLEELYQQHRALREANPEDSQLLVAKYQSEDYRVRALLLALTSIPLLPCRKSSFKKTRPR